MGCICDKPTPVEVYRAPPLSSTRDGPPQGSALVAPPAAAAATPVSQPEPKPTPPAHSEVPAPQPQSLPPSLDSEVVANSSGQLRPTPKPEPLPPPQPQSKPLPSDGNETLPGHVPHAESPPLPPQTAPPQSP
eukprot:RCo029834